MRMALSIIKPVVICVCVSVLTIPYLVAKGSSDIRIIPFQKGMCYATWSNTGFLSPKSDESLASMSDTGVNCVQIVPTWYQKTYDSTIMTKKANRSPTDKSIIHAIRQAHSTGMAVMLKPHIDLIANDGNYRADIGFSSEEDWEKWCKNYINFITQYAKMAQRENVEYFCVGTELSYASTRTAMWKERIIPAVKKHFEGKITYAANWDNYKNIDFWDELDFAGIDAYFPLCTNDNPTVRELKGAWKKWVDEIEAWQDNNNMPVAFTEVGYCSSDDAAKRPWEEAFSGLPNLKLQANCYEALIQTFSDKTWFCGVYWWKWNTYAGSGGKNHKRFTPQNKPAMNLVKVWYNQSLDEGTGF